MHGEIYIHFICQKVIHRLTNVQYVILHSDVTYFGASYITPTTERLFGDLGEDVPHKKYHQQQPQI